MSNRVGDRNIEVDRYHSSEAEAVFFESAKYEYATRHTPGFFGGSDFS